VGTSCYLPSNINNATIRSEEQSLYNFGLRKLTASDIEKFSSVSANTAIVISRLNVFVI
jgi:hypothetical protein